MNTLPPFPKDLIGYLYESALKPAISDLLNTVVRPMMNLIVQDAIRTLVQTLSGFFVGMLISLGNVIIESFKWGGEWIAYMLESAFDELIDSLNQIPGVNISKTTPAKPSPIGQRISGAISGGFSTGQVLGREIAKKPGPRPRGRRCSRWWRGRCNSHQAENSAPWVPHSETRAARGTRSPASAGKLLQLEDHRRRPLEQERH